MGGRGSGGARVGAGPKKKDGPRHACGRLAKPPKTCACGRLMGHRSKSCMSCARARRAAPIVPCVVCGVEHKRRHGRSVTCGAECGKQYLRQLAALRRDPASRSRRNAAASRVRRARGARSVSGRWRVICERDGYVCWICGDVIDPSYRGPNPRGPSVDHVVPLSHGGSDDDNNLRPAHFGCNSRRGAAKIKAVA
jgi:5-methylcytosine-specific restriction endonuclease McrA